MKARVADSADQLSVQQLRTFCRVHELQSYSAAARELGLSVPAVWEQVQSLQSRYGTLLFEKLGRRITTTPAGELLYGALQPVLAGLDSTFDLLCEDPLAPTQPITLVCGVRMMQEELGPALRRFQRDLPTVPLRILHRDNRTAQELIASGGADLALMLRPGPGGAHDALTIETVYTVDYLAVVPRRHPLARKRRWRLGDIVSYPVIIGHSGTHVRQLFEQALHRESLSDQLQVAVETDNSAFTIACVKAGMGIGVVAGVPDGELCHKLRLESLRDELGTAKIVCQWKRGRHLSASMARLVQILRDLRSPSV